MANIIPCSEIQTEVDRLKKLFKPCYKVKAEDLDDLSDLVYSASLCGTGDGDIPTFDQNNIVTIIGTNYGLIQESNVVTALNSFSFTVDEKELVIIKHTYIQQNDYITEVIIDYYLFRPGKGTFGSVGTPVALSNLFFLRGGTVQELPTTPGTTSGPRVLNLFAGDVPGSTISTPHLVLNGTDELITITSAQDTYFAIYNNSLTAEEPWNLYLFTGAVSGPGDYGNGPDNAVLSDFQLIESFSNTFVDPVPNGQIKWREINVPAPLTGTSPFDSVSGCVNNSFRGQINIKSNENVLFIIDRIGGTSDSKVLNFITEKWVWNKGEANNIASIPSTDDDYYLIETTGTKVIDGSSKTNNPVIFYTEWNDITDVNDAVDAVNSLTGSDRVVLNDNLVLIKISLDDGSNNYKVWEFTGAVTGDGTYGVSGLTAVAGDFNPTPFVTSDETTTGGIITASDVYYEDSVTNLGAKNVQQAIEALDTAVDAIETGSSFKEITTGDPNFDTTIDAWREGRIGLGESTPAEFLDIVSTETLGKGGIKFDYTWNTGAITRIQFGGQNILSELGVPSNSLEANLIDNFAATASAFTGYRAYWGGGDLEVANALLGEFAVTTGISNLAGTRGVNINIYPYAAGPNPTDLTGNIRAFLPSGEQALFAVYQRGGTAGFDEESLAQAVVSNGTQTTTHLITPHITDISNLLLISDYGSGTFIQGYTHTDDIANTGTSATTIGAATYYLGVDSNGVLMEVPTTLQLEEITTDSFTGDRWQLVDTDNHGFIVDKSANGRVGYEAVNTNTGSSAASAFAARTTSSLYADFVMISHFSSTHFSPFLQSKGAVYSDDTLFFLAGNNSGFDFRSGPTLTLNTGAWNTSLLQINVDGTIDASSLSIADIDGGGDTLLVTKEWVLANTRPYLTYTALLTVTTLVTTTSGTLEVGKTYVIASLEVGDDFSNVGYIAEGTPFVATGTTPTNWTNSTVVTNITDSAPNITVLENTTGETVTWTYDYDNGGIYTGTFSDTILDGAGTAIFYGNGGDTSLTPNRFYRGSTSEVFTEGIVLSDVGNVWSVEVRIYPVSV